VKTTPASINRRAALGRMTAGAALATVSTDLSLRLHAADNSAPATKGRINHSVCKWCYSQIPLEDLCVAGKTMGLQSIELLEVKDFPTLKKHDLICAMVSGVPGGITSGLNRKENHDKILAFYEETAPIVANAGFKNIICFSGNRKGMSDEEGLENCAVGLKRIMPVCEKYKVLAVMELLNSKIDHADYMCDHTKWGVELVKRVSSDNFKLLYDIYHMQIMEGDVIRTIRGDTAKGIESAAPYIAHYHTGGVPGRHEIDDSQELYYPAIMTAILETGFKGHVAQEFIPKRPDAIASLRQGVGICDV
jgi:hydroxypyruvate isomerase